MKFFRFFALKQILFHHIFDNLPEIDRHVFFCILGEKIEITIKAVDSNHHHLFPDSSVLILLV